MGKEGQYLSSWLFADGYLHQTDSVEFNSIRPTVLLAHKDAEFPYIYVSIWPISTARVPKFRVDGEALTLKQP